MRRNAWLVFAVCLAWTSSAAAGGPFMTDRGVRALGRGGAFVAGAQGAEALWYNPAGLANAGHSLHIGGTLSASSQSFERDLYGAPAAKETELSFRAVPEFGYTHDFGLKSATFGLSFFGQNTRPYARPYEKDGRPSSQRFSGLSSDAQLYHLSAGFAWHGVRGLSIGFAPQLVLGSVQMKRTLSMCEGYVCAHPEDPSFDVQADLSESLFSVTLGAGVTYDLGMVRLGASLQTPFRRHSDSKVRYQGPTNDIVAGRVDGQPAEVSFELPLIARLGVQISPIDAFRFELAFTFEGWEKRPWWSVSSASLNADNVIGVGSVEGKWSQQTPMQNTYSARLGAEYFIKRARLTLRWGGAYETSAVSDAHLSPTAYDADRLLSSLGLSVHIGSRVDLDAVFGHVLHRKREVRDSQLQQSALFNSSVAAQGIGNGTYTGAASFVGLGMRAYF